MGTGTVQPARDLAVSTLVHPADSAAAARRGPGDHTTSPGATFLVGEGDWWNALFESFLFGVREREDTPDHRNERDDEQ